jgi:hypothetical protein
MELVEEPRFGFEPDFGLVSEYSRPLPDRARLQSPLAGDAS